MKKLLLLIVLPLLSLTGCAPEAKDILPPPPEGSYTVTLSAANSTLTTDDSTGPIQLELKANEDDNVIYKLEIGAPCYIKNIDSYQEIIVKSGAYIKSISKHKVSRLIVDIYEGKGINYEIHNTVDGSGTSLPRHDSNVTPVYKEDNGAVYEYEINSEEWSIINPTTYNKPAFYSVTVVFENTDEPPYIPPQVHTYTAKLDAANSTLTTDDSTGLINLQIPSIEDEEVVYELEIGAPCYLKTVGSFQEIIVKNGAFFRSASTYKVTKLLCDIYAGKGIAYEVYASNDGSRDAIDGVLSTEVEPVYPEDNGKVYEYAIDSDGWSIINNSSNKPAFYSVTIVFEA